MKKHSCCFLALIYIVLLLAACTPETFSPPMQIHITAGDHVEQSTIAIDDHGISHIAGVVGDRVVYYRTRFGPPILTLTMTMGDSGLNWKQYSPDIAVRDGGHAYLTWVEQRGGSAKYACWRLIPFITDEPNITTCNALDSGFQTAGHIKVVARGDVVYAVYDRITDTGDLDSLRYKELTNPTQTGAVVDYIADMEFGHLFKFDLAIDSNGKLHVAYLDHSGYTPFTTRLNIRSNVTTSLGDMSLRWRVYTSERLKTAYAPSLTFYQDVSGERVAAAFGWVSAATDEDVIHLARAYIDGYTSQLKDDVVLPPSWDAHSTIGDISLLGIADKLIVSFIGDDNTGAGAYAQVYVKDALNTSTVVFPLTNTAAFKTDLEMLPLVKRDDIAGTVTWTAAWLEFEGLPKQFYATTKALPKKVLEVSCVAGFERQGEIATNNVHYAGVMEACGDTWFSLNAYLTNLPLIAR